MSGALDEAEVLWEGARQVPESRYQASVALSNLRLKRRKFDAAELVLQEIDAKDSSQAEVLCGLARVAAGRGDHEVAAHRWQVVIATHENHRTALAGLMRSHMALNQLGPAAAAAEVLTERFPEDPSGPVALAQLAALRGSPEESFERFSAAHIRWPDQVLIRRGLAQSATNTGRWTQANTHYSMLRDANPKSPVGETGLASLRMRQGRWLDALELWERLCLKSPDDVAPRVGKARALLELGRADEAEALSETILDHPGGRAAGLAGLAQVSMRRGAWLVAIERWTKLGAEPSAPSLAEMGRAQAYDRLGQPHAAEEIHRALATDRPDLAEAQAALIRIRSFRGRQTDAVAAWQAFLERFPERLQGHLGLASALAAIGRYDQAEATLLSASDRFHDHPEPRDALARIEAERGEDANAASLWLKQQHLSPWRPAPTIALLQLRQFREGVLAVGPEWMAAAERWPYVVQVQLGAIRNAVARDDLDAARALFAQAKLRFPGHLGLAMAEVNIEMRSSPDGDTAMAAVRAARRRFPEAAEPLIAYARLYSLMYQQQPPDLEAICEHIQQQGSPRHMVTLAGLLISTGAFERARTLLDTIETLSDAVGILALSTKLRVRLALFVDQEPVESVLTLIESIPRKIREREGISLPTLAYAAPAGAANRNTGDRDPNGGGVAVLCHIFHKDLIETLMAPLDRLHRVGAVFYFSLSEKLQDSSGVRERLRQSFPDASFIETPNAGFDVGGYWNILSKFGSSELPKHENVVILHTKKCGHAMRAGDMWREHLSESVAGSDEVLQHNLTLMQADPRVQMIGSLACMTLSWAAQNNNTPWYLRLRTRVTNTPYTGQLHPFIPGTMFMARMQYVLSLYQRLRDVTFEPYDTLDLVHRGDLTVAHAIERLFGTTLSYLGAEARYLEAPPRMLLLLDPDKLRLPAVGATTIGAPPPTAL